jgi:F-type H+-transporting ATPase subunit a
MKKYLFFMLIIFIVCIVLSFMVLPKLGLGAGLPTITLPAETLITNLIPGFNLTNGLTSMIMVDAIVLVIAVSIGLYCKKQTSDLFVPENKLFNLFDSLFETAYEQAYGIIGDHAPQILPLALTVFLFILTANTVKLLPGVETIGFIKCALPGQSGYPLLSNDSGIKILKISGSLNMRAGIKATEADTIACSNDHPEYAAESIKSEINPQEGGNPNLFTVIPIFRPLATDINMPLAIALVVFVTVEAWGIKTIGLPYIYKFINIKALKTVFKKPAGLIDILVGIIELLTEFMRLVSLTFRLLGSMLAGSILLAVMIYIIAFGLPLVFVGLEVAMGILQAYVFTLLTVIYAKLAISQHE